MPIPNCKDCSNCNLSIYFFWKFSVLDTLTVPLYPYRSIVHIFKNIFYMIPCELLVYYKLLLN